MLNPAVAHDYTLADLHAIARTAAAKARGLAAVPARRYEVAWEGVVDALVTAETAPSGRDLVVAGIAAVNRAHNQELHHAGLDRDGVTAERASTWWRDHTAPVPSPERGVVETLALTQIWPQLSLTDRVTLATLAAARDYTAAASALGLSKTAFTNRVGRARRAVYRLWHEHETPPAATWRVDRAAGGGRGTSRRRPTTAGTSTRRAPRHGTVSEYTNHRCRCRPCTDVATAANRAQRARREAVPPC